MRKVFAERFHVVRHARSGGMGEVFLCDDAGSGKRVAVKVLSTSSPRIVERFLREAEILAELDHPSIVRHVAHGLHDDVPYLAMAWIDGETLADRLTRGALSLADAMTLGARVGEALGLVHARGIVHRDVKPSNIVLEGGAIERAVLLDFGIAHVLEAGQELTRTGDLLGTPGYMAPEQASGGVVDARIDVFALGCVLFRCVSGRTPFPGADPLAVAIKLLLEEAPRLSQVVRELQGVNAAAAIPRALDALVARTLARAKDERPRDGFELRAELSRILDPSLATQATPAASTPTLGHEERRVMSLVLARSLEWEPSLAAIQAIRDVLEEPVAKNKAVLDVLADGCIVVTAKGGAPHDVATRAARCAIALREELPDARVVVSTGHGVMEADAPVGELVDQAVAMLESLEAIDPVAPQPEDTFRDVPIRIDATSAGLLGGRFDIDGDSQLLSLRRERNVDRARTLLGKPTPFVGRTRELATLDAMLAECAEESVSRAVLVTANPGVGKSRLREEYLRRLRERDDVQVWMAHGDPVAQESALGLVSQLLRTAFGIATAESAAKKQRKIVAGCEALGVEEPRRLAEFLGEIAGVPFSDTDSVELRAARRDPQLLGARIHTAFETFVKAKCTSGPLLIVLEDLHWGDAASLKLVDRALAGATALPLLVLSFARPEVWKLHPTLFAERGLQEIRLLELTRRASGQLVSTVLGAAADAVTTELVIARAQGNAFFLEELIRAVAEGRSALPETVLAMVEARLDELDATSRKVLRAASIFGEEASFGGVHALAGGGVHELAETLSRLADAEYLSKSGGLGGLRTEAVYRFRHALVREAAYAMLTNEDRTLGHHLAGEWLAQRPDPDPLVLADHFDRGGDRTRSREYVQKGAEQAFTRCELDVAVALAERASIDAKGETLAACRMLQAEANIWRSDADALPQVVETLSLIRAGTTTWFRACCGALFAAGQAGDARETVRTIQLLRAAQPQSDDSDTASYQVWAYSMATWILALTGIYDSAKDFHARAESLDGKLDDAAKGWLSAARMFAGKYIDRDPWKAHLDAAEAASRYARIGDMRLLTMAYVLCGATLADLGAYEESKAVLEKALDLAARNQISAPRGEAKRVLGQALEGLGRVREALQLEEQAEKEVTNTLVYRGAARAARAWLLSEVGEHDVAAERFRAVLDDLAFAPSHRAQALGWLSRVELRCGRRPEALQFARQAEQIILAVGTIGMGESLVYVALVEALEAMGDKEAARTKLLRGRALVLERASRVMDEHYKRSFLERVRENRWLLSHEVS